MKNVTISDLVGKVLTEIKKIDNAELIFITSDNEEYKMLHYQDCCEEVRIEDICGDLDDLIGSPITLAEEVSNIEEPYAGYDSYTWTFYKLATLKGYVDIRWLGESNGYYSEEVDFIQTK